MQPSNQDGFLFLRDAMSTITVNASMEDKEKAVRELAPQVFFSRRVHVRPIINGKLNGTVGVEIKKFGGSSFWLIEKNIVRGKPKDLFFGIVTLNPKTISVDLLEENIEEYTKTIAAFYRKMKRYEDRIDVFLEKLSRLFGDTEDPTELSKDDAIKRYGTERDLSLSEVKRIVRLCNRFTTAGGKVPEFHNLYSENRYELETLRKWLKAPKFAD